MNGVLDPVVTGEKIEHTNALVSFVSIMCSFLNTSFYVASILCENQLTVFHTKGCMEKVPK